MSDNSSVRLVTGPTNGRIGAHKHLAKLSSRKPPPKEPICMPQLSNFLKSRLTIFCLRPYATEATNKKLTLSLVSPYESFYKSSEVEQVNLSSTDGDVGILAGHVPAVFQLLPGVIEVFETSASAANPVKKALFGIRSLSSSINFNRSGWRFLVSGGFALVHPDSSMEISAMEAMSVDKIDGQTVAGKLTEAQKRQAAISSATSEGEKAEIAIHLQVYQALSSAINKFA